MPAIPFPIGKHLEFKPYYEHQNNTGKSPNRQLNQLGLILNLYFSSRQHVTDPVLRCQ
jgi:hypothetical protein